MCPSFEPVRRELGHPGVDDRSGHRDHPVGSQGEAPGSAASDHPGQRPAVHRQRKIERRHKSLKGECIRPGTPLSLDDARRLVSGYVDHYNDVRLNSATGYITRSATGSWRRPGNNGRFVASRPLDPLIALSSAWACEMAVSCSVEPLEGKCVYERNTMGAAAFGWRIRRNHRLPRSWLSDGAAPFRKFGA